LNTFFSINFFQIIIQEMSLFGSTGTSTNSSPFGAKPGGLFGGTTTQQVF